MPESAPAIVELLRLASTGLTTDADVRWFTGPHGWLAACRDVATGARTLDPDTPELSALLDDLDDRSVAAAGPSPSDRARLLADVAALIERCEPLPTPTECARLLFGPGADRHAPAAFAAIERLARSLTGGPARFTRSVAVPIAVSTHDRGEVVRLNLAAAEPVSAAGRRRSTDDETLIAPDLVEAPFQRWGLEFLDALADARHAAALRATVWFTITSERTSLPIDAIAGRSAGLGAAIGCATLAGTGPAVDPGWVVTGDVAPTGEVVPLERTIGAGGYSRKLPAVGDRTLVLPAADAVIAGGLSGRTPLIGVSDLAEARQVLARHDRANDAYRRTMGGRRWRLRLAVGALSAAGILGVAVWRSGDDRPATGIDRSQQATGGAAVPPSYLVPEDPRFRVAGRVRIATTELTNAEYARCVRANGCTEPDPATAGDWLDPARGTFPVTGITAAQAEQYCQWAGGPGWGLPTFAQMQAAMATAVQQFPYGRTGTADVALPAPAGALPTELQQVDGPNAAVGEPSFLAGNVAEWTRTACSPDGTTCSDQSAVADLPMTVLRVFGVPFDAVDALVGSAWFEEAGFAELGFLSESGTLVVGARCALEVPT